MATIKEITNRILDGTMIVEDDGGQKEITKREAFVMRLVQDAISDEDPAIRQKAAALVLELCGWKNEVQPSEGTKTGILNKNGKPIGKK